MMRINEPAPDVQAVIATLESIKSAEDENELKVLDDTVQSLGTLARPEEAIEALLGVLERFSASDGYGVFWGILSALEKMLGRYEGPLARSIERQPSEFSLHMLYRILKSGQTSVDGVNLYRLLESVAANPRWTEDIREGAQNSIAALKEYGVGPP